jgi:hypothetical protein
MRESDRKPEQKTNIEKWSPLGLIIATEVIILENGGGDRRLASIA